MKILFLSDINSGHTRKWVTSLSGRGFEIGIFSLSAPVNHWWSGLENVAFLNSGGFEKEKFSSSSISKSVYISFLPKLRKIIRQFKPDLVHAHYATSYGLLGAASGFHPFVLSVWGSDVFDFPKKSFLHNKIFRYNLRKADMIMSTSHIMALEAKKYTSKTIEVTPFGVNVNEFSPRKVNSPYKGRIVLGTVKSLEEKYGTEFFIRGFAEAEKRLQGKKLTMLIVGDGSLRMSLENLSGKLNIQDFHFTGRVDQPEVAAYHNMIDIYVSVSVDDSESFGVSAVEASACGKPCIVSDAGGLKEVVVNGVTGIVVPRRDESAVADAIIKLVTDPELRKRMGMEGRERVLLEYNWEKNLAHIISLYNKVIS